MRNNLDLSSLILQLYSLIILFQDYNNRDLMQELQKQDSDYLEKIIQQNNHILIELEELKEQLKEKR